MGAIDVALLPTNGLRIRAQFEMQVVMDHRQAAQLAALLRPKLTMPHHCAFTSDPVGDMTITRSDEEPAAVRRRGRRTRPVTDRPGDRARHQGRVVNSTGPGSRTHAQAVIAVLDAKPNCAEELAALVQRLTPHVRAEPGRAHAGTCVLLLVQDLHIRVINADTGELIRELILNPDRDYQPTGKRQGWPKKTP